MVIFLSLQQKLFFNVLKFSEKNHRQNHKMDYMLFASVIKIIFLQKSYIMSSINNENSFNIKLVFEPGTNLKRSLQA